LRFGLVEVDPKPIVTTDDELKVGVTVQSELTHQRGFWKKEASTVAIGLAGQGGTPWLESLCR
jgi:hypothetical protein